MNSTKRLLKIVEGVLGRSLTKKELGMFFGFFKKVGMDEEKIFYALAEFRKSQDQSLSYFFLLLQKDEAGFDVSKLANKMKGE